VATLLQGCSSVDTRAVDPWPTYASQWRNAISVGEPSARTGGIVATLELEALCRTDYGRCADAVLAATSALLDPDRLLAAAELDYLAARAGEHQRYWSCAESAYRALADTAPGPAGLVAIDAVGLALGLYDVCVDRALASLTPEAGAVSTTTVEGRYRITVEWPPEVRTGATLRPASEINVAGFRQNQTQTGAGAAYVLVPTSPIEPETPLMPPGGLIRPVTAIATFEAAPQRADRVEVAVRFEDPYSDTPVVFGNWRSPLAADYTAPLALMVGALGERVDRLRRLVRPGQRPDLPEVYAVTPYDPGRTTVVMIHGLGSGPLAWLDLTNELLGDPQLRSKIQVWHCRYASGYPVLYNRRAIAQRLEEARRSVDPELDDRGTNDLVLVGHSMGGLIARLLVSASGETLWEAAFPGAASGLAGTAEDIAAAREGLTFEPLPYVTRAIFVAAPQRGAPLAGVGAVRALGSLIELPADRFDFLQRLVRDNPDAVDPQLREEFLRGGSRSVDMLSPDHPIIRASSDLPIAPGVPVHVISGTGWPVGGETGDGLVPVSSTLVDGAESTVLVRATHEVQKNPRAILEIKRILREHVAD
jgi:pimeloyl-ACP methyl ester carboxylesterase